MRDLTKPGAAGTPPALPKGLAFDIADLLLVRSWAGLHNCRISIQLDHGVDGEEYEEVIALHTGTSPLCQSIIWRNAEAVFIQPLIGRSQRHASLAEALESIALQLPSVVTHMSVVTDITATVWPTE
jgi:hypothetical protein